MKEQVLIVGLGEVGHPLHDIVKSSAKFDVYGSDIDKKRLQEIVGKTEQPKTVDVMHICYPCTQQDKFVQTTIDYIRQIKPKLTIIESTVPPGTTQKIYALSKSAVANSPIRGMHKSLETMKRDMLYWTKYVGGTTKESADAARKHFEKLGLKVKVLKGSAETELAKLFETTYRAWMVACFQEMHRISRHFGADFDDVVDMLEDIHRVRFNKPLHFPGVIGGHCLIPNVELLLSVYDSEFLHLILESNDRRKEEIKDKTVAKEIEKVEKRTRALEEDLKKLAPKT